MTHQLNAILRDEILEMRQADLDLREELAREGSLFGGYADRMAALHRRHNTRLRTILTEHGWPGRALVGEEGAAAAWLLLQHAVLDPPLMRDAVQLVERAVQQSDAEPRFLAYLVDRIRTLEGRPQVYGTQHDWNAAGELSPLPIEDPAHVDERRRLIGLESLAKNTRRLRAQAKAEGDGPPTNFEERQREGAEWARSLGWRP
jgi:hypothetical protein